MDDLTLDANFPIATVFAKCVIAFGDDMRRCCVNANGKRATLDNFDRANLVMCMLG